MIEQIQRNEEDWDVKAKGLPPQSPLRFGVNEEARRRRIFNNLLIIRERCVQKNNFRLLDILKRYVLNLAIRLDAKLDVFIFFHFATYYKVKRIEDIH